MAALTSMLERMRSLLMDENALIWPDGALTEALRLALGEYSLALSLATPGASASLEGLDGAVSTSIPAEHESAVVWGASGYAALARAVDRAESFQRGSEAAELKAWGDARLNEFKAMLAVTFPGYRGVLAGATEAGGDSAAEAARLADLRNAAGPAWGCWGEEI